ncbi:MULTISPECIES: GlcG/HbpS family heme-binding protein [Rhodococcus]|jgi:uncharacterized protein GlcG (DUF336 family)|uniref:GlcG protein n=1 Tax=Rhodococcus opacus RKJ300 = JCM 13270 TaxID=1165867 RepID=I0WM49_RHOOP|nr:MULTISPECIES: heme-binding protein [Rhodococcus]EID77465.1 hypothetical protein W59_23625 [Rhodococcus opacus RKJ300 = JCM 13270]MDV6246688.1 heme-binding protein [Rhodococcus opacus]QQZ16788.1 heme-binding protein [Rhodococcus sp. 21391]
MKLSAARLIIENAQKFGHDSSFAPLAIVVLDGGGKVVASERQDGASMGRHEIAFAKAYGALALGVGSRALMNRAEQQPYFTTSAGIALGGALVPVPGGVLVLSDDATAAPLGAVGISGENSDRDESAAVHGIIGAGLIAKAD